MKLIQTENCSIVYGTFQGKENQELFRCPRALDNVDLKQYINENRCFLGIEADDVHDDLHNLPGYLGYYRLYFSGGWCGRWMYADKGMSRLDCAGVDGIVEWLSVNFPKGCNYSMREFLSQYPSCSNNRYLLKPLMSEHYKIMFDTKYGRMIKLKIYLMHWKVICCNATDMKMYFSFWKKNFRSIQKR